MVYRAESFWVEAPGRGAIRAAELKAPSDNDVVVRTLYSGISRGTESLVFQGRVPASQRQAMRAPFQEGDFPAPVKYGYASVGVVEAGPPALIGRTVFCLHPHQTRYVVPVAAVVPLPDGLPPERAVLAANMETAVNALWDAAPLVGDRIVVVGAGVVGCLVAYLAGRLPGARVELSDIDPRRAANAERLGVGFGATPDADLVIHASGSAAGAASALALAGFEATVLELSWYGDQQVALPLGESFHAKRLVLKSSQVGAVAPARRARRTYAQRLALALELLRDPVLDVLISGESPFHELPAVMARLAAAPDGALCHRIAYP